MAEWQTRTDLTQDEFRKFTAYFTRSNNPLDNRNRAAMLGFSEPDVMIAPGANVRIGSRQIGRGSFIGLFCYVNGPVTIGENVLIGPQCVLAAGDHTFNPETQSFSLRSPAETSDIRIGDGSWLAGGCIVTAGVRVGKANLICANAVVTRSTSDYAIMAGTPAKQVGEIDPVTGEYRWYNYSNA